MSYELIRDGHLGGCVKGGDTDTWEPAIWNILIDMFDVQSILDVGCGEGWSTRYFLDRRVYARGIEGSSKVIAGSPHKDILIQHDYTTGPYIPDFEFDAIWSCEFVEHVDEKYVPNFLETFAKSKFIFMTYSEPQWSTGGYHHVNCKDQNYWNEKMKSIGFDWDKSLSYELRDKCQAKWVKPTLSIYKKL